MAKLVAGMDMSGDPGMGNDKFLSIVIGTEESVDSTVKRLGSNTIHMHMVKDKKTKDDIISTLKFDSQNCIALCIRIDKTLLSKKIIDMDYVSAKKFYQTCNYILFKQIRPKIEEFLIKYNCTIHDVTFQCDGDCMNLAKDVGLRYGAAGNVHMLADIVAWANNRCQEPDGVISIDIRDAIKRKIMKKFRR